MTSQVAITLLKSLGQSLDSYCELNDEGKTAFSMAITALELFGISEQLPSVQPELSNNSKELENKNGELISRQALIDKKILDMTCGSKTIWFNKNHPAVVYCDKRKEDFGGYFGKSRTSYRTCHVNPDVQCDFTHMPFDDNTFALVVFDPPHLTSAKDTAWLVKKYGKLDDTWPQMLHDGFAEGMRVLKPDGILIFKWSEYDIPATKVWESIGQKPLFGHHSGKKSTTFWACFMKGQK